MEIATTQGFLIKPNVGFVITDIQRDIGIFEIMEDTGLFQTRTLEMAETIGCGKESIAFPMKRFEHLFGTGNEGMGSTPSSTEGMLEGIDSRFGITDCGNELLRVEIHDFSDRIFAVLGFGEESATYLEEELEEIVRILSNRSILSIPIDLLHRRIEGRSTTGNVIEKRIVYVNKNGLISHKKVVCSFLHTTLSGRRDSNSRPPAPKAGILTGLNYYPLGFAERVVNRSSEAR